MLLSEILVEAYSHERILQNIAVDIVDIILSTEYSDAWVEMGELRSIFKNNNKSTKTFGLLFNRLGRLKLTVYNGNPTHGIDFDGLYDSYYNELTIVNSPLYTRSTLEKTVVHELRHALDKSLSKGKSSKKQHTDPEFSTDHHLQNDINYYSKPAEINARFSEVQLEMVRWLKVKEQSGVHPTASEFINQAMFVLHSHNLSDIFPHADMSRRELQKIGTMFGRSISGGVRPTNNSQYKQLLKRLYKFYINYVEER